MPNMKCTRATINKSANIWFFDGHAEGLKLPRLQTYGIKALAGQDTIPSYIP
jgi:prepilin-type processing-associated H-X9-DG protein